MNPEHTALARARTYAFIAEVLLDGWTPRAIEVAKNLPIGPYVPTDPEARAARHQQVFGRSVPPYESVFRSADGLLGGATAHEVRESYERFGFRHTRSDVEPDHLGLQCAALSFLCAAEADARRDGVPWQRLAELQHEFVGKHLGQWVDLFHRAVQAQGISECSELTGLLVDVVSDHATVSAATGEAEDILANPKTGLKAVGAYLLVPARCGVWLGSDDIQRVADRAELACGFGRRQQMMESLWFSAVDHERVPALCSSLLDELQARGRADDPRLHASVGMLNQLATSADAVVGRDHVG